MPRLPKHDQAQRRHSARTNFALQRWLRFWRGAALAIVARRRDIRAGMIDLDPRRRRLLFRASHRGTRENDLMIGGFVASRIGALSEADLETLERLLDLPDAELADWLSGRVAVPAAAEGPLLRALCAFVAAGGAAVRP